jgi:hypothetical protein
VTKGWLRALVAPLGEPGVGAATGYRWFLPDPPDFWSLQRGVWDAVAAGTLGAGDNRFVWGGATAIRKVLFFDARVPEFWEDALTDDLTLSQAVHAADQHRLRARRAHPVPEHTTGPVFFAWIRRQMALTRLYAHVSGGPADHAHLLLRRNGGVRHCIIVRGGR